MEEKSTTELDQILNTLTSSGVKTYISAQKNHMITAEKAFYYYYKDILESKNIRLKDVYTRISISYGYGSKIVTQEKHTNDRDLIIKLCLGGHFNLEEINHALKLYGFASLYSKDPRDACIIVAVNNKIFMLEKVNEILTKNKLATFTIANELL